MNEIDDKALSELQAYVDGELDEARRASFEAALELDPALQQALAHEQRLRSLLGATYAPVLSEALPERLSGLLKPGVRMLPLAPRRAAWNLGWAQWGGMAASLVLGGLLGYHGLPGGAGSAVDAGLQAHGTLVQALDRQLAGETLAGVTPGISFLARDGHYCRSFVADTEAGLACREGEGWRLRQLETLPATPGGSYRMAASALPPALLARIDALREGDPLDAAAEREARARGWLRAP